MTQHEDYGSRNDLVRYRIETAKEDLSAARLLFEAKAYKPANNRAYYAIFHAVNAVHVMDGNAYKRHKDAIASFNKNYVRTELFPKEIGRRITGAEAIRHASDYDDFYIASREETEKQITVAEEFVRMVEDYGSRCLDYDEINPGK